MININLPTLRWKDGLHLWQPTFNLSLFTWCKSTFIHDSSNGMIADICTSIHRSSNVFLAVSALNSQTVLPLMMDPWLRMLSKASRNRLPMSCAITVLVPWWMILKWSYILIPSPAMRSVPLIPGLLRTSSHFALALRMIKFAMVGMTLSWPRS